MIGAVIWTGTDRDEAQKFADYWGDPMRSPFACEVQPDPFERGRLRVVEVERQETHGGE